MNGLSLGTACVRSAISTRMLQSQGSWRFTARVNPISLHRLYSFSAKSSRPLKLANLVQPQIRRIMSDSKSNFSSTKTLLNYRLRDGVPKTYEMIYRTTFGNYILSIQAVHFLLLGGVITVIGTKALQIMFPRSEEAIQKLIEEAKARQIIKDAEAEARWQNNLRNPRMEDVIEGGLPVGLAFIAAMTVGILSLIRFQRNLPIRMYSGPKGHTIAIMYGHVIPFRSTRHEFLAGSLKVVSNPTNSFWKLGGYTDSSGKYLILLEHYFRRPADLNRLCGFQKDDSDWIDDEGHMDRGPIVPDDEPPFKIRPTPLKTTNPKKDK